LGSDPYALDLLIIPPVERRGFRLLAPAVVVIVETDVTLLLAD
jgi:hypothetical protein